MIADNEIIEMLFQKSESALSYLAEKYGKLCRLLSYNILHNTEDTEECVNDTYMGVWNTIPPKHPECLKAYTLRICRNISIAKLNHNNAQKRNSSYDVSLDELVDIFSSKGTVDSEFETKELTKSIECFLDSLTAENRVLFIRRYWYFDEYKAISERLGISEKNVSVKLTRLRKKLKDFLIKEGQIYE